MYYKTISCISPGVIFRAVYTTKEFCILRAWSKHRGPMVFVEDLLKHRDRGEGEGGVFKKNIN